MTTPKTRTTTSAGQQESNSQSEDSLEGKEAGPKSAIKPEREANHISQIRDCIALPHGAAEAGAETTLEFNVGEDGMVTERPTVLMETDPEYTGALVRAILRCGPYAELAGQTVKLTGSARGF